MANAKSFARRAMRVLGFTAAACVLLGATGCATVKFMDAKDCSTGFDYFPAKPYLLVGADKDGNPTATVISLPDVGHPKKVQYCRGIGTAEYGFTVTNGMITAFNAKSDTKVPEMITAVTSGISSLATAVKTLSEASGADRVRGDKETTYTVKAVEEAIPALMKASDVLAPVASKEPALKDVHDKLGALVAELNPMAKLTVKDSDDLTAKVAEHMKKVGIALAKVKMERDVLEKVRDGATTSTEARAAATRALDPLKEAIGSLKKFAGPGWRLELYEIVSDPTTGLRFVPVELF